MRYRTQKEVERQEST